MIAPTPQTYTAMDVLRTYLALTSVHSDLDVVIEAINTIEELRLQNAVKENK